MNHRKGFQIRIHDRSQDEQIFDLQQLVYPEHPIYRNRQLTRKYWQWRYFSNPAAKSSVFVATVDQGTRIVGMRPISYFPLQVCGRSVDCAMLTAVITHPDFRKRGIFTSLVDHSLGEAKSRGAHYAFAFPNENSLVYYRKQSEWRYVASVPLAVKVLDAGKILRSKFSLGVPTRTLAGSVGTSPQMPSRFTKTKKHEIDLEYRIVAEIDDSYASLWGKHEASVSIGTRRSTTYLKWRYLDNPTAEYQIVEARNRKDGSLKGYAIVSTQFRYGLKLGLLVDAAWAPGDHRVGRGLVRTALRQLKERDASIACTLANRRTSYANAIRKNGFRFIPEVVNPKHTHFVCTQLSADAYRPDRFFSFDNWMISWGDTDNA